MALQKSTNPVQRSRAILITIGIFLVIAYIILTPRNISDFSSQSNPAQTYTESLDRAAQSWAQQPAEMNPVCELQLMTHGKKVDRVIILVHGYTNCPQQFKELGQQFYDIGYNVLIAPLPHHGLADRMTEEHALLKAEELTIYADEVVDIAQGLGDEVIMMGISAGGITTAWAAQHRSDIDLAVIISPAFGFKQVPTPLTATMMNIYLFLPNSFVWWDPVLQENTVPVYTYPRYSKQALAQTLRLGFAIQADAKRLQPEAQKIIIVINPTDEAVNNPLTMTVVKNWEEHGANLTTYEFDANLQLWHDLIDPTQPYQQIDVVYPILIDLANQ